MPIVTATCNKGTQWRYDNNTFSANISGSGSYAICADDPSTVTWIIGLDFNWPTLSAGATIIRASVEFYMTNGMPTYNTGSSLVDIQLNYVTASWTEGQANYPTFDLLSSLPTSTASNNAYVSQDITAYVRDRYGGTTKYGLLVGNNILRDINPEVQGYGGANPPRVQITYEERFLLMMV